MSMWAGWLAALVLAQADAAVPDRGDAGSAPWPPPILGPENDIDDAVLTGATGEQTEPQAAWDGKQFLATWRSSLWQNELRAARLGPDGKVLDPRGVPLDKLERADGHAAVAATPDGFLLAWVREPSALTVARVLAPEGGPLQILPPLVISPGAFDVSAWSPSLAEVRGQYWMLWTQSGTQTGLFLARMDREGRPGAPPVRLGDGHGPTAALRVPLPTTDRLYALFAVPAGGMVDVRLLRLDAQGQPLEAGGRTLWQLPGVAIQGAALVAGGSQLLAAAAVIGADGKAQVRATRLDLEGTALDVAAAPLATGVTLRGGPTASWDGQAFRLMWAVESRGELPGARVEPRLAGARVGADGSVTALPAPPSSTAGRWPHLVQGAPWLLWEEVAWWTVTGEASDTDLRAYPLDAPAATGSILVSAGRNWQSEPAAATNGTQVMVVFEDRRDDKPGSDIYAARISPEGALIDRTAFPLATGAHPQRDAEVAWDGKNFVAVWQEGARGLVAARIAPDGTVLDRPGVVIAGTDQQHVLSDPAVCGDPDGTLIVWGSRKQAAAPLPMPATREAELRALRLPAGASPAGAASVLLTTTADATAPVMRLGCNDKAALVVWSGRLAPSSPPSLYAGRILRGSDKLDRRPGLVELQRGVMEEEAGVATDGAQFLVTWRSIYMNARTIWGMRIDQDGFFLDSPAIQVGTSNSGRRPTAWWDGQQYVVTAVHTMDGLPFELRARRVSGAGEVLDAQWFPLARLAKQWGGGGSGCVAVPAGPGRTLLVYESYADDDGASNPRARARLLTTPLGIPPEDAAVPGRDGPTDGGADAPSDGNIESPPDKGDGCGCRLGGASRPGLLPLVLVLAALLRRRRRR